MEEEETNGDGGTAALKGKDTLSSKTLKGRDLRVPVMGRNVTDTS